MDPSMLNEADILLNSICDTNAIQKFLIKWKLDDHTLGFPVHLRNKCAVESTQAVLTCLVNGSEPLTVRWYKDNREIFDGEKYFIRVRLLFVSFLKNLSKDHIVTLSCDVRLLVPTAIRQVEDCNQGPVAQSIDSLTSSLVVKMFTVLVSTISNSQVFLLKKNVSTFCKCKTTHIIQQKNISVYAVFNDKSFNNTLTNNVVTFEQLGPEV